MTPAAIATTAEIIVSSNAGATMPVMSSSLSRAMYISVAIPVSVNTHRASAEYFTVLKTFDTSMFNLRTVSQ